jgi:RimJ/RimL family protein N-acetyltransferase
MQEVSVNSWLDRAAFPARELSPSATYFLPPKDLAVPAATICPNTAMTTDLGDSVISLRPFESHDLPALYSATRESIQNLCAWMTWCRPDYSLDNCNSFLSQTAADWNSDRSYTFAILDAASGNLLGSVGLSHVNRDHNSANLGYWVRASGTGRGVASRAVRLISRFALRDLRLARLEILIPRGNVASQRVAQKVGARFEGVLRKRLILNGSAHNAIMFSLVTEDLVS